jgi:tRNA A-37 threonylcarbamoyl transferase component Bud32
VTVWPRALGHVLGAFRTVFTAAPSTALSSQELLGDLEKLPKRFGPFVLIRELGVGGMGAAYLAMHVESGALLVVKRMHPEFLQDEAIFKRFVHEAEVAAHVRHPNVAALVAMGTIDQEPFLATEYVFGIQVSQIVDRIESSQIDPVPLPIGLSIAVDLASGVEAIHNARHRETGELLGLIHRDIGSRNMLVGFDGMIRIIDLGLGKSVLADWQTASQVLAGSPDYMCPEQAMGARVDGRADIYSAAVTCWELLAGRKRIREEGVAARLARAIQARPEPLIPYRNDASKKLEAVLQAGMNPDPERRTPTAAIFKRGLQEELSRTGKKKTKEDVAAWLDSACATVIAREKRLLEDAREKALALVASNEAAKTEILVGAADTVLEKDASPYNFYTGVAFAAAEATTHPPVAPIEADTAPSLVVEPKRTSSASGGARIHGERLASPNTLARLVALDPRAFNAQPKGVRAMLIAGVVLILVAIATITAVLVRPRGPAIQVTAISDPSEAKRIAVPPGSNAARGEAPKDEGAPGDRPAAPQDSDEARADESNLADRDGRDHAEGKIDGAAKDKGGERPLRALAPEVESKKSDLIRRIRQLRRVRFDVSFQRKITQLSTRLSKARTMKALDEVESALVRLEKET